MNFTSSAPPGEMRENGSSILLDLSESTNSRPDRIVYYRMFWEQRRLFAKVAVGAVLVSTLIAFLIPSHYRATAQLMPPDETQGMAMALMSTLSAKGVGALGGLASGLLGMKDTASVFVGVLKCQTVADRLIEQFQLLRVYGHSKIEDARDDLEGHTDIMEDHRSGLVKITVTDHDPRRAAAMAQAYVNELDRLIAEVSTSSARRERIFLEGRLKEVKADLDVTSRKFSEFASKNAAIDITVQGKAMVDAAAKLQGELIAAQSELGGLEQIYSENNVRIKALRARVNELRQQLAKLGGDPANPNNDEGMLYPSIRKLPVLGVTYADLFRQIKVQEVVYDLLTEQYEMAKVEEAKEIPTVKVLDRPLVPTKKSFPPRLAFICLGTILGVLGTGGWIVYRKKWKERDPHDPRRQLAEEIGASIRAGVMRLRPTNGVVRSNITEGSRTPEESTTKDQAT